MKRIFAITLISVAFLLVSCSSQQARKFNDELVTIKNDIVTNTEMMMKGPDEKENKLKADAYIKQKLVELQKVDPVKGGEALKQAMVDDIKALSMVYDISVKLTNTNLSEEEMIALETQQKELLAKIEGYDRAVALEQEKFAKEKGLQIEKK